MDVTTALSTDATEPVTVIINSPGGDMTAGSVIYTLFKERKSEVTAKIVGDAYSAASHIAVAGTKTLIAPLAMMMIHNAWTHSTGNASEMENIADMLREADEAQINAYELKTKLPREQIKSLMDATTYMSAARAIELGFADAMLFAEGGSETTRAQPVIAACASPGTLPTETLRAKARALIAIEEARYGGMTT